jgi:hypothetical protein
MPKVSLDLTGKWEFKEYPLSARRMRDLDSADWRQTNARPGFRRLADNRCPLLDF